MAQFGTKLSIDALRPLNRWSYDSIRPGMVGSVGDVLYQTRLKQSAPDMEMRWVQGQTPDLEGDHLTDGAVDGPRTIDKAWSGQRGQRTLRGWVVEDLRAADMLVEPFVGSLGDYDWRNKLATVYESRHTGDKFLPLPGPYQLSPGEVARGGNGPRIVGLEMGDLDQSLVGQFVNQSERSVMLPMGIAAEANPGRFGTGMRGYRESGKVTK